MIEGPALLKAASCIKCGEAGDQERNQQPKGLAHLRKARKSECRGHRPQGQDRTAEKGFLAETEDGKVKRHSSPLYGSARSTRQFPKERASSDELRWGGENEGPGGPPGQRAAESALEASTDLQ